MNKKHNYVNIWFVWQLIFLASVIFVTLTLDLPNTHKAFIVLFEALFFITYKALVKVVWFAASVAVTISMSLYTLAINEINKSDTGLEISFKGQDKLNFYKIDLFFINAVFAIIALKLTFSFTEILFRAIF